MNSVKHLYGFIWMPAFLPLSALQLELSFNFNLKLMFKKKTGDKEVVGELGMARKKFSGLFCPWHLKEGPELVR